MTREPHDELEQPFATARGGGFLFRHDAFARVQETLNDALNRDRLPVVVEGPKGVGKTTLIRDWFAQHVTQPLNLRRIKAASLPAGRVADAVLTAFAMAPSEGAGALDALGDFVDDQRAHEGSLVVVVTDLEAASGSIGEELASLTKGIAQGGVQLPLIATWNGELPPAHPLSLSQRVQLSPLGRADLHGLIDAIYDQAELDGWRYSKGALAEILRATRGLPGSIGELVDQVHVLACEAGTRSIKRKLVRRAFASADRNISPADIEAALASLEGGGNEVPIPKGAYPRIEPADIALQHQAEPANDPPPDVWDEASLELEEMVDDAAALHEAVGALRLEVLELRKRLQQRRGTWVSPQEAFVAALQKGGSSGR